MALKFWKKDTAPVDPLAEAAAHHSRALDVFNRAKNELEDAVQRFQEAQAQEAERIRQAQERHDEAVAGQERSARIVAKLNEFTA